MNLIEILRAVFLNIKENKLRVFLTSLGIIVGTFTIIMVVGIGKGSSEAIEQQFASLSAETIMIRSRPARGQSSTAQVKYEDAILMKELTAIREIAVSINANVDVSYGSTTTKYSVVGVNEEYSSVNNLNLSNGEFFTNSYGEKRKKVAIIGITVAQDLLGLEDDYSDAIGERITIKGRKYEVMGVLESSGDTTGFSGGTDSSVFVPYEVAEKYVAGKNSTPMFNAQAVDINSVDVAVEQIEEFLEEEKGDISNIMIIDAGQKLASAKESEKTMSALLIGVATIVLIVGGIGIMNVLLVSVKERTKEIGILKGIGATKKDILLEFLFESIIISISGGAVGSILSFIAIPIMGYTDLQFIASIEGVLLGIIFSVITGTFFGYYPAMKAAQLKPIDALNYE